MLNKKHDVIISFHYSFSGKIIPNADNPIYYFFEAYNLEDCPEIQNKTEINNEALVLVNYDHPEYSILYKIIVKNTYATLRLEEFPDLGKEFITENEIKGIKSLYSKKKN